MEPAPAVKIQWQRLRLEFHSLLDSVNAVATDAYQLSQTRLAYTQILESRKAIEQADGVRRLTTLAFVFIPLTYVASVFSAGIDDMNDTRNAKNFAISSILITVAAILASLTLEQHLWPFTKRWLNRWRNHVYGVLVEVDREDKAFGIIECIFLWRTYSWGPWNLHASWENWIQLPLATVDLGRLRIRQLLAEIFKRNKMAESQSGSP